MRIFLTFAILVIISSIQFGEGGIYRRYVRRSRPRPPILHDRLGIGRRADFQQPFGYYGGRPAWSTFSFLRRPTRSSWNFMPSRVPRRLRYHHHNQRSDNNQRVPHFHHQQQPRHYSAGPQNLHHTGPPRTPYMRWGPFSNGNPIVRDPTFDYAPPTMDHVRLIPESRNRRTQMGTTPPVANYAFNPYHHHQRPPPPPPAAYRPSASLWKMLAHKQRPKRPYPPPHPHNNNHIHHHPHSQPGMRYHGQSPSSPLYHHQAEIVPKLTNMVMFKPTDVVSSTPGGFNRRPRPPGVGGPGKSSTNSQGIGSVSSVPLYSHEQTSSSELRPVAVVKPTVGGSKEYIFTVVGYKGPSAPATSPLPPAPLPSTTTSAPAPASSSSTAAPSTSTTTSTADSTTRRSPTLLHAVKTTPVTPSSTHNSAVKPFEPTESLGNNHRHPTHKKEEESDDEHDESAEESKVQEKVSKPADIKNKDDDGSSSFVEDIFKYFTATPPDPIHPISSNSFNIGSPDRDENESEESDEENDVINIKGPVFNPKKPIDSSVRTSMSMSVSVSKDEVSTTTKTPLSTKRPLTSPTKSPVRKTTPKPTTTTTTTTEASSTTSTTTADPSTTSKTPKFANLPVMPKYTRNKTPVYAKKNHHTHKNMNKPLGKYSSASSSSALSKEINGSGEIVVITGGRSKVKEYKPQFISENSGLLAFDKVASSDSTSSSVVSSTSASPLSTSTTRSPLSEFDPMQLIHSWLNKASD